MSIFVLIKRAKKVCISRCIPSPNFDSQSSGFKAFMSTPSSFHRLTSNSSAAQTSWRISGRSDMQNLKKNDIRAKKKHVLLSQFIQRSFKDAWQRITVHGFISSQLVFNSLIYFNIILHGYFWWLWKIWVSCLQYFLCVPPVAWH